MKSGIELIAQERQEQIEKHKFTPEHDKNYKKKELVDAAEFCLLQAGYHTDNVFWPISWDRVYMNKILNKTPVEQMVIAGAFFMAENDRRGDMFWQLKIYQIAAEIDRIQADQK